jgi:hypothetical protein
MCLQIVWKLLHNFKLCITLADMQMTHPLCINWFSVVPFAALYWFLNSWPEFWKTCDLGPQLSWTCIVRTWNMVVQHDNNIVFKASLLSSRHLTLGRGEGGGGHQESKNLLQNFSFSSIVDIYIYCVTKLQWLWSILKCLLTL